MKKFNDLALSEAILRALSAEGYTTPTPIQAQVIPAMLAGQDVLGTAQTGTGKTASFVLPLLNRIAGNKQKAAAKSCSALILVPTRELAGQVVDNIRGYGQFMTVSVAMVIGGAKAGPQIQSMKKGVDILVATPGRLEDLMSSGDIRLDNAQTVVLDEADQMLDFGFVPAIRRILKKLPASRQTALLSATMPPAIRGLAGDFLNDPTEIAVAAVSKPIEKIRQQVIHVAKAEKRQQLVQVLAGGDINRAVVFTRTKHGANRVTEHLEKAGLSAAAIHGNKSQNRRQATLAGFRSGEIGILVATDIAARGIDVDDVTHVVNFELPNVPEVYVHRIGRTARAGKSGIAISLVDQEEAPYLRDIQRLIGMEIQAVNDPVGHQSLQAPAAAKKAPGKKRRTRRGGKNSLQSQAGSQAQDGNQPRNGRSQSGRPQNGRPQNGNGPAAAKPNRRKASNSKHRPEKKPGQESPDAGLNRMFANIGG